MGLGADARIDIEAWLTDKASAALDAIKRKIDAVQRQMVGLQKRLGMAGDAVRNVDIKTLGDESEASGKKVEGLRSRMLGLGGALMTVGSRIRSVGQSMTIGLTTPIVAAGFAVTRAAMDYDTAITRIITLTNNSQEQVAIWSDQILDLAGKVGIPPTELADALFYLSSAGLPTNLVMETLEVAAQGAALGMGMAKDVALAMIPIMNAYADEGLRAADVMGMLQQSVAAGTFEVEGLANALPRGIATAKALGIPINDLLAMMTAISFIQPDVNEAMTEAGQIWRSFLIPSEKANKLLAEHGTSMAALRAELKDKGLLPTLRHMWDMVGGDLEKVAILFPRVKGIAGLLNLTGQDMAKVDEVFAKVAAGGADDLAVAWEKLAGSDSFQMRQAQAEMQANLIILGREVLPYVVQGVSLLADGVGFIADKFEKLSPWMQKAILGFAVFLAILGPGLIVFGALVAAIGAITLGAALIAGAILAVIIGVTLLGVAAYLLWRNWDLVKEKVGQALDWLKGEGVARLKEFADAARDKMQEFGEKVLSKLREFGEDVKDALDRFGHDLKDKLRSTFAILIDPAIEAWQNLVETTRFWWNILWPGVIEPVLRLTWANIQAYFSILKGIFTAGWGLLLANVKFAWNAMQLYIALVLVMIHGIVVPWVKIMINTFQFWGTMILNIVRIAFTIIKNWLIIWWALVTGFFRFWMAILRGDWGEAWEAIKDTAVTIWNSLKEVFQVVTGAIADIATSAWGTVEANAKIAWQGIKDTIIGTLNAIKEEGRGVLNSFIGILEAGINGAIDIINGFSGGVNAVTSALNKFPGPDVPAIPVIPRVSIPPIDTGGLIKRTGIALVHRGEVVLNELQQRMATGNVTNYYQMQVTLARGATRKDAENLLDWIEDEQRKRRRRGR